MTQKNLAVPRVKQKLSLKYRQNYDRYCIFTRLIWIPYILIHLSTIRILSRRLCQESSFGQFLPIPTLLVPFSYMQKLGR